MASGVNETIPAQLTLVPQDKKQARKRPFY